MHKPVVMITGALTGIGRATAFAFAREGARLAVSGRGTEAGQALAAELRAAGADAIFLPADVRNEDAVSGLVEQTVARFGRLDVAVNNAGTEGRKAPLTEQTAANYEATFSTNVLGMLLAMKHEMRVMLAQGSGSIINLSSILGHVGCAGGAVYSASKHAVEGMTKCAALEGAAAGVRVNAVAPGPVATAMLERVTGGEQDRADLLAAVPAGRVAAAEEIAQTILFLASDRARYLNGQSIAVDGAYLAQ